MKKTAFQLIVAISPLVLMNQSTSVIIDIFAAF